MGLAAQPATAQSAPPRTPSERAGTLMVGLEAGVSHVFAEDRSAITAAANPGGSLDVSLLWRSVPWVAMGLQIGFAGLPDPSPNASTAWVTSALAQVRFLLPVHRVDLWAELGVGFGALTQTGDFINADRVTMLGPNLAGGLGVDVHVHRLLSVGAGFRVMRIFTGQYCLDGTCARPGLGLDPGVIWRAVVSFTYHISLRPPAP